MFRCKSIIYGKLNQSIVKRFFQENFKRFTEEEAAYNGVLLRVHDTENYDKEKFSTDLLKLLEVWKSSQKRSAFLQIPISMSHCISVAAKLGFEYHHATGNVAVLSSWLEEHTDSKIPSYSNHTVGVAGACYNELTSELLVVQDKGMYSKWWKFPGGYSNKGEFISETAIREIKEETGIIAEFKSVLSLRHLHNGLFDQSDIYFICRLLPITYDIKHCTDEIQDCRWIDLDTLLHMTDASQYVKLVCRLILDGKSCDFKNVDIVENEMVNWVLKKRMKLYHRPLN
ncbi:nucleoside diphosphate-linked moiety X motif 6 isoform X1 [Hydra vulgaris]|uniref:nucleoside diphosphate-linked moiety X motif 6 isoform X1 n=1 Tax=Hydra vulgaris TaxID=6087 RepID=UPI001F5F2336|nr:nucleoside diphosphate-linked moiety X motif 6 isoform X1 [Hydra vulgaris]